MVGDCYLCFLEMGWEGSRVFYLVSQDLTLGVVFKMSVPLEPALDELAEFVGKGGIEEVVHAESGAGSFARVGWADPFLCRSDAG